MDSFSAGDAQVYLAPLPSFLAKMEREQHRLQPIIVPAWFENGSHHPICPVAALRKFWRPHLHLHTVASDTSATQESYVSGWCRGEALGHSSRCFMLVSISSPEPGVGGGGEGEICRVFNSSCRERNPSNVLPLGL